MSSREVLIVGAGGLGVPAAWALARAGLKELGLIDPDPVELSNLPRQVIYRVSDIGLLKVAVAARRLADFFPALDVRAYEGEFDSSNAKELVERYRFIIDATDNPRAKFLINDTCVAAGRPFVYAGVIGLTGQAMTVLPGKTPCLRCLFEEAPDEEQIAGCRAAGIVGPVAGAIGEVEAHEALAWLSGQRPGLAGAILSYDGEGGTRLRLSPLGTRKGCGCGAWSALAPAAFFN